jgi:hypothetical protein
MRDGAQVNTSKAEAIFLKVGQFFYELLESKYVLPSFANRRVLLAVAFIGQTVGRNRKIRINNQNADDRPM